jgi:hypothetical protein
MNDYHRPYPPLIAIWGRTNVHEHWYNVLKKFFVVGSGDVSFLESFWLTLLLFFTVGVESQEIGLSWLVEVLNCPKMKRFAKYIFIQK